MTFRPKFDSIYSGEWKYEPAHGVGIRLIGRQASTAGLIDILCYHGCPIDLAHRIAEDMQRQSERSTTVFSTLNFDELAAMLSSIGIKLEIVPPRRAGAIIELDA